MTFCKFFQFICLSVRVFGLILAYASWKFINKTPTSKSMKKYEHTNIIITVYIMNISWLLSSTGPSYVASIKVNE